MRLRLTQVPPLTPALIMALALALTLALVPAFAGCGVTPEKRATPIDAPGGPFQALTSATPAPTSSGSVPETLFMIKDGALVPQVRHIAAESSVDELIADLLAGPTEVESDKGLSSALVGVNVLAVHVDSGLVTVDLAAPIAGSGRNDELLAYAQVVCTLTTRRDVQMVTFTRAGKPIDVPRGDSSVSPGPLTAGDYANLIAH
jgi:Sporulation and spore germination